MVIVLTGMQSINKKLLARIIMAQLNKFEYKGYYADFTNPNFSIYDSKTNECVFRLANNGDVGIDTLVNTDYSIVKYFLDINQKIFFDYINHNQFLNIFCSLDIDYGITSTPKYYINPVTELNYPHKFDDVIENIKKSTLDVKVIIGTFGKHFIDELKTALKGKEEVKVLNIIRNPSVSWIMNKKTDTNWISKDNPDFTEENDIKIFFESILNSIELKKYNDVYTIKFEDIMKNGKIELGDSNIYVSDDFLGYNEYINKYEQNMEILMDDVEFATFNDKISNYILEDFYIPSDDVDEEKEFGMSRSEFISELGKHFPINIFEKLGYDPVDRKNIIK